jgi:Lipid A 3-O-deacylase (PagL)
MKTKTAIQRVFSEHRGLNNLPGPRFGASVRKSIICLLVLFSLVGQIKAQNYLVGVRGGSSFESDAGEFQQADLFAAKYLPWLWGSKDRLTLKPRWEASVGFLHDDGQQGFVGTTGPVIELRVGKLPVTLEGGISLTALSRFEFPDRDLGGWFEFTDHAGLNWHITKQFTVGWRYQHMSNAGFYKRNPGLNLQMLSASYTF